MEKLSKDSLKFIQKLIKTCSICGIEDVAIEPEVIRGQSTDNSKGIFMLETENIPTNFGFSTIGIPRIKVLGNRIAILDQDALEIGYEGKERDNGDIFVRKLVLSSKRTKVDFSCQDVMKIKAPRRFTDPFFYGFSVAEDTLKIMAKAATAIDTTKISFSSEKDGSVKFRTSDVNGDMFDHLISETFETDDEADKTNFFHEYEIKYVLPLFRAAMDENGELNVNISKRGVMKVNVNGFHIYVLPEA
jgi:hypothetical protein